MFYSLASFLVAKYDIPNFFWTILLQPAYDANKFILFLDGVAKGESAYQLIKRDYLTVPLTRKMCHKLITTNFKTNFNDSIRHIQFKEFGGNEAIYTAFLGTRYGNISLDIEKEKFIETVIKWLSINKTMLNINMVEPIIDYVAYNKIQNPNYSIKGRTVLSIMRGEQKWYKDLDNSKDIKNENFSPCGLVEGKFITDNKVWTVSEILTGRALLDEGKKLRHCVYSYASSIKKGYCSIWSMQQYNEHKITIEVVNPIIIQAKGCNREINVDEYRVLLGWAKKNGLHISKSIKSTF
jgi:hypothetical protein